MARVGGGWWIALWACASLAAGCGRFGFARSEAEDAGARADAATLDGGPLLDATEGDAARNDAGELDASADDAESPVDARLDAPATDCGSAERCNGLDDDCDGRMDEGFDLETNPAHCGACNAACASGSACAASSCGPPLGSGGRHTCALRGGVLRCWGENLYRQLGIAGEVPRASATRVTLPRSARAIGLGGRSTCAILDDGTGQCWGDNRGGQTVTGSVTLYSTPHSIGLSDLAVLAMGGTSAYAILSDGSLRAWGANFSGQVGDGTTTLRTSPVSISGIPPFAQIAAGSAHVCAIDVEGRVWCWGQNGQGQAGDGTAIDRSVPTRLPGLAGMVMIGARANRTCALRDDGAIFCWGYNDINALDTMDTAPFVLAPSRVARAPLASAISVGDVHACAITRTDEVYCWGNNADGAVSGTPTISFLMATIPTRGTPRSITSGGGHSCVANDDGTLECWGSSIAGERGDGVISSRLTPTASSFSNPTSIAIAYDHVCVHESGGGLTCRGRGLIGELGDGMSTSSVIARTPTGLPLPIASVAAGARSTCAVANAGATYCWGQGTAGQLGHGISANSPVPARVTAGGATTLSVDVGEGNSCGVSVDARALCWGANHRGQLGDRTVTARASPVAVEASTMSEAISTIAASTDFACALTISRALYCWGHNADGQLGAGPSPLPREPNLVTVGAALPVDQLGLGVRHACARSGGAVYCWGNNSEGALGLDTAGGSRNTPQPVALANVRSLAANNSRHTCAVTTGNALYCWGANEVGQLGLGDVTNRTVPTLVLSNVSRVDVGASATCATLVGGAVSCWGLDLYGQLGIGPSGFAPTPVLVTGDL